MTAARLALFNRAVDWVYRTKYLNAPASGLAELAGVSRKQVENTLRWGRKDGKVMEAVRMREKAEDDQERRKYENS